jgi:hypothetical protein
MAKRRAGNQGDRVKRMYHQLRSMLKKVGVFARNVNSRLRGNVENTKGEDDRREEKILWVVSWIVFEWERAR